MTQEHSSQPEFESRAEEEVRDGGEHKRENVDTGRSPSSNEPVLHGSDRRSGEEIGLDGRAPGDRFEALRPAVHPEYKHEMSRRHDGEPSGGEMNGAAETDHAEEEWRGTNDPFVVLGTWFVQQGTPVTKAILALNAACFLAMVATAGGSAIISPSTDSLIKWGANYGVLSLDGEPWRLLSGAFVHAGAAHLAINMYVFWDVARLTERLYGSRLFLLLYLCCAFAASLVSLLWNPAALSVGASGAVLGVWGGFLGFFAVNRRDLPKRLIYASSRVLPFFLILTIALGFLIPNMDNAAHIGGLLAGFLFGFSALILRNRKWGSVMVTTVAALAMFWLYELDRVRPLEQARKFELQQAMHFSREQEPESAIGKIDEYLDRNPQDAEAHRLRALILEQLERWEDAEKAFSRLIELKPDDDKAYGQRAFDRLILGRYQQSIEDASLAISKNERRPASYIVRARARLRSGDRQGALEDLQSAEKLDRDNVHLHIVRSDIFYDQGDYDRAVVECKLAVRKNEKDPDGYTALSVLYFARGDFEKARETAAREMKLVDWKNRRSLYPALIVALSDERLGKSNWQSTLAEASEKGPRRWPQPVVQYLLGKLDERQLLAAATTNDYKAEAQAYIGLSSIARGDRERGLAALEWVLRNGSRELTEWTLSHGELRRQKQERH